MSFCSGKREDGTDTEPVRVLYMPSYVPTLHTRQTHEKGEPISLVEDRSFTLKNITHFTLHVLSSFNEGGVVVGKRDSKNLP